MKKEIVTQNGDKVLVDTDACEKKGFRHEERVMSYTGKIFFVIGVGPMPSNSLFFIRGDEMLWVADEYGSCRPFIPETLRHIGDA